MAQKLSSAKVARMVKNPGSRSKVPSSQLPARYRKMRRANAATAKRDDPNALTAPLTPRGLDAATGAAADVAYAPAERVLEDEQRVSGAVQTSIPVWFQQYQGALQAATNQTKATYAAAAAGQQNAVNSSGQIDAQHGAELQQSMQADAAARGAQVNPQIAAMAQQAAASRRQAGDAQTGLTLGLGAANVGYRAGQQVVGAGQQLQAQMGEAQRARGISAKQGDLALEKGKYATKTRQDLINTEHTKQIERKAFQLDTQKAANDVAIEGAKLTQKQIDAQRSSSEKAADRASRESIAGATLKSREREGHLTRLTRKQTAKTIAAAGNISPTERRRRNTAVNDLEQQREKAVSYASTVAKQAGKTKVTDPATGKPFPSNFVVRRALEKKYPGAPKQVIDYAMAAALGGKAGVTKKGQPDAAKRYRAYMKKLADGSLAG